MAGGEWARAALTHAHHDDEDEEGRRHWDQGSCKRGYDFAKDPNFTENAEDPSDSEQPKNDEMARECGENTRKNHGNIKEVPWRCQESSPPVGHHIYEQLNNKHTKEENVEDSDLVANNRK